MMDPITMMPITRSQTRAQEPTYNPEPTAPPRRRIEVRIPQRYVMNVPKARINIPESASEAVKITPAIIESIFINKVGGVYKAEPKVQPKNGLASES